MAGKGPWHPDDARSWRREFPRLPALAALRAFEAAARHESFSRAAAELFVTHGAVSHQIRALEEELGQPLFERRGKRVALTVNGRVYAERVRDALLQIADATRALQAGNRDKRLTISTMPSFAARWLTPRIGSFIERHPELDVELLSSNSLVDFGSEEVDIALRMGSGDYPGLYVERLLDDRFFPVCSPDFNGGRLPELPQHMAGMPLLRGEGDPWKPWFEAAGLDWPEPRKGLLLQDSSLLLQAAAEGQGIALIRSSLAYNDLLSGRVVRLFDVSIACPWLLYFVCSPESLELPKVQAFRQWLLPEMERFRAILSQWTDKGG
ncbi:transcriptional regulator GcvA [Cupriavidus plantarum]|uniref:LysR family transcriptional regulator n=1 Tax=Cupriavidus plantarum TaxID=942865 RepID=A0A316F2E3_9BURK|nr:transcriptional regulator GcvA [Cupriavidus plantarum]NYH97539.1 LysR family glycine cleavage system transcriptional activator [Cupriavidus plantarum]PWK38861.1 LysR family transcriptional regulator [Cupriavidus plantarum]REE92490.1 LysR family transcriptional regulator [Cupriavidus plantarum]CAG2150693.1 Glycine cleavage system transcriptional activator [Cupriavidus plantarum]SMR67859.1 transcriptional regulator, LysR family [Cupriavidus plantarum]